MAMASLKAFNTLAVESLADGIETVASDDELIRLAAEYGSARLLVLGEGSNILLAPRVPRIVCLMRGRGIDVDAGGERVEVTVAGGENWHQLVMWTLAQGYYGLENLALIPGSAGAAPVQNIGAYGVEVADFLRQVEFVDLERGVPGSFTAAQCGFGYRDSLFKQQPGRYAITRVTLALHKEPDVVVGYPELQAEFQREGIVTPSPQQVADAVIRIRQAKLPDPALVPNAGSFFKNPVVSSAAAEELQQQYPVLTAYPAAAGAKLSAAQLIDLAGWKQRQDDGIRVWPRQPLVLVNEHGGDGQAVLAFAEAIAGDVEQRYGVRLEIEPDLIGFF